MPQMAPMSWMLLFISFSATIVMTNILNYYIYKPIIKEETKKVNMNNKNMNWKW